MTTNSATEAAAALRELVAALERNADRSRVISERAREIEARLAKVGDWRTIVDAEEAPPIVELVTRNVEELHVASARFRRAEAHALHDAGMTISDIAEHFGVSRQRVSALLNSEPPAERPFGAYRHNAS